MRVPLGGFFGVAVLLTLAVPVQAENLLNCRLIDPGSPDYKRYCMGELSQFVVRQCSAQRVCTVKAQNFTSTFSARPAGALSSGSLAGGAVSGVRGIAGGAGGLIGGTASGLGSVVGGLTK
jgi:hypothetical protein